MSARILVVDDSEDEHVLYRRALKDFDCALDSTHSAGEGLDRIASHPPDLVLLDYNLPDLDGLSFIRRLDKHSLSSIPVVMLTGEGSTGIAVEALKLGAKDYLVKDTAGVYLKLLPEVIAGILATNAAREETARLQRQSERLLHRNQTLMENSLDGIHILDANGNLLEANEAFCAMLGFSREELIGKNVAEWDAQFSNEEMHERIARMTGKKALFETLHRRKDGSLLDVEVSLASVEIDGQYNFFAASRDISARKCVEAALERHKQVIDTSIDGYWLMTMDGYLLEANDAYAKISGYSIEELIGMHISRLEAIEETPQEVEMHIRKVLSCGYDRFETRHRHKDGHEIDIEVSSTHMPGSEYLVGFCRDISERKKMENLLRENEARLKELFEDLSDGVAVYRASDDGMDFYFSEFNRAAERIGGIRREELLGKNVVDIFPGIVEFGLLDVLRRVWKTGKEEKLPAAYYRDGNIEGWRENYVYKLPNGEIVAIFDDVSEKKEQEENLLRQSKAAEKKAAELAQQFGQLLQSSFNEIYLFDAETLHFLHASEGAKKNLGYQSLTALTPLDIIPSLRRRRFEATVAPLRNKTEEHLLLETSLKRKDGSVYPVEVRMQLTDAGFLAIIQDISERKEAEAKLADAYSQLRRLTNHMETTREEEQAKIGRDLHDEFGALLVALNIGVSWIKSKLPEADSELRAETEQMGKLVKQGFQTLHDLVTRLRPTLLDEVGLLAAVKYYVKKFQEQSGIECKLSLPEGEFSCEANRSTLLFRILQESLTNAAKHSAASEIVVSLKKRNHSLMLSVKDNGVGFSRHAEEKKSFGLIGIRERAMMAGGRAQIVSVPGEGTRVSVTVPEIVV